MNVPPENNLELYHSDYSTCSQKVRLVLEEKKLGYKSNLINFRNKEHLSENYLALNPNGVVPTLVHNGQPVVDSSVIVEYLDEVFPHPTLSPEEPVERARMRTWMRFIEEVPTTAIRYPSFQKVFIHHFKRFSADEFESEATARPLRTDFYRRMGQDGFSEREIKTSMDRLRTTCERIEDAISRSAWLICDQYTLADAVVTPIIDRMVDLGLDDIWQDLNAVQDWWHRIQVRSNFNRAFYPGSRVSERDDQPMFES